jgi:hypothetical protein
MTEKETPKKEEAAGKAPAPAPANPASAKPAPPPEVGGRNGPEPTRYGDWEVKGICSDF